MVKGSKTRNRKKQEKTEVNAEIEKGVVKKKIFIR